MFWNGYAKLPSLLKYASNYVLLRAANYLNILRILMKIDTVRKYEIA